MERSWIVLVTVLQMVMFTSVNPAETTNNYHQIKASSRALDLRSGQLQVSTDRTFTGTRQPKPQKRVDHRRPSLTINASVQRRQQQQQQQQLQQQQHQHQQQQQQYGAALSHSDWTPIVQSEERLQKDYQQQQVRQPDAIVAFVTPPPRPPTTTTHYNDELLAKNQVQHLDDEIDDFRNYYPNVNASEVSEGYNNKLRNVTRTINAHGAVDENHKNSYFGLNGGVLEKNTTDSENNYNNRANAAKEQNKHYPQLEYSTDGEEPDEENNRRPPQSYDFDFQLNPRQNGHHVVITDVQPQLAGVNNDSNGQIANDVRSDDRRTQNRYRENQNYFHLLGSKSDVVRDHPNNVTAAEVYDGNIVYTTNAVDVANELQRLNYNEDVDDGAGNNNDFNYFPLQYANGVVGGRGNSTHRDALVGTDSKASKPEDGRKFVNFNRDASKNKHRVSSDQYVNANVTAAAGSEENRVVKLHERPRGHKDERRGTEIENRRRQKPSVIGGDEVNPTVPTTTSARSLRRKVQSPAESRRPPAEDNRENGDGTGSRTLYDGRNGYERKQYRNDRGRITTPSDKQPSVMTTSRAPIIEQDVIDDDDDYIATGEELEQAEPGGYGFAYTVLDENVGMDFGQWERREPGRTGTVTGLYRVRLPDGRTQTVKYTVSPATGYKASVTYEGVQRHPSRAPPPRPVEDVEPYDSAGAETRSPE